MGGTSKVQFRFIFSSSATIPYSTLLCSYPYNPIPHLFQDILLSHLLNLWTLWTTDHPNESESRHVFCTKWGDNYHPNRLFSYLPKVQVQSTLGLEPNNSSRESGPFLNQDESTSIRLFESFIILGPSVCLTTPTGAACGTTRQCFNHTTWQFDLHLHISPSTLPIPAVVLGLLFSGKAT